MGIAWKMNALRAALSGPAGAATVQVIFASEDGILLCYGNTKPSDSDKGYAPGCLFLNTAGSDATALYVNEGTAASANFNAVIVDT